MKIYFRRLMSLKLVWWMQTTATACSKNVLFAIPGRGKSAGWRIVLAKREVVDNGPEQFVRWLLLLGFSKHEQDNIKQHEVDKLKTLAKGIFDLSDCDFDKAVSNGLLIKVIEGETASEEE